MADRRRMTRAFLTVWLGFTLLALLFYSGHLHLTDEEKTVAAARALWSADSGEALARYHYGLLTLLGTACLPSFPLLPLLLFGLTAACCHRLALNAGLAPRRALMVALLACASSSLLVWSEFVKDEVYAVAALAGALAAFSSARPRVAALCLALAVLAKPALIMAALPLAFAAGNRRHILLALLAIAAAAGLIASDNVLRFGTLRGGYPAMLPNGDPVGFSFPVWLGLAGHLFSPLRSIFLYNPFLLLVLPRFITRLRRRAMTRLELCSTVGALAYLLLISAWTGWEGEVGFANRLALPVMILGTVFLPVAVRTASRGILLLVLIWGLLINLPGAAWDFANYYQMPQRQRALVFGIRRSPLSSLAFEETATIFTAGYQSFMLAGVRLLSDNPDYSMPPAGTPLEYHFWFDRPDLWPVYLHAANPSWPRAILLLSWLVTLLLCLLLLRRLWRRPPPPQTC